MDQFILCPSCGFCYAPYMEFLNKSREVLYKSTVFHKDSKIKDYDPEKISLNNKSTVSLEEIFTAMNISNRCCKMRMMSHMAFGKLYK